MQDLPEAFMQLLPTIAPLAILLLILLCKEAYDWVAYTQGNPVRTREEAIAEVEARFEERRVPAPNGWIGLLEGRDDDAFVTFFREKDPRPMQLDQWERSDHRRLHGLDGPKYDSQSYTIHVEGDRFIAERWAGLNRVVVGDAPSRKAAMDMCIRYDVRRGNARRGLVEGVGRTSRPSY